MTYGYTGFVNPVFETMSVDFSNADSEALASSVRTLAWGTSSDE